MSRFLVMLRELRLQSCNGPAAETAQAIGI
jgi:hypothetical protein